jgi:very-short-patch-repair endonuclease
MIEQGLAGHNFEDLTGKRFDNLVVDGIYNKKYTKGGGYSIRYNCTCDCGAKVIVEGGNLRSGHTTSCGCKKESYIVKNIIKILNEMNINYRKEKVFDDLKSENNVYLRMDIYLPDYNTVIEIDGEQHFYKEPKNSIFTEEAIRKMKCNDKKKDDYCEEKGIVMVRIPYYEWKNVNKEYILNKIKAINI